MKKEAVRKQMLSLRKNMTEQERKEKDARIRSRLYDTACFRRAECFFPFVSYGTEVDTRMILQRLLDEGKKVAVPKVYGQDMEFYVIHSFRELEKGTMGILEPVTEERVVPSDGIMLLPGLAFDLEKNRFGYGGGYYDRYFEKYPCERVKKIALAYDFQVVEHLETEHFDRKADFIITDQRII